MLVASLLAAYGRRSETAICRPPHVFYVASDSRYLPFGNRFKQHAANALARPRVAPDASFFERPQTLREGSTLPAFDTQAPSFGAVSVAGSLAIQNPSHALSPGPQPAPAPQFRLTPCGAISSRSILPLAAARSKSLTDLQTILPTPLRSISRVLAKVSSSTRLPVDSIVRSLAISRWSAQNSL